MTDCGCLARRRAGVAAWLLALLLPAAALAAGLHDDTRRFTPAAEMTPADWSDPAETERAWQANLRVRISYPPTRAPRR